MPGALRSGGFPTKSAGFPPAPPRSTERARGPFYPLFRSNPLLLLLLLLLLLITLEARTKRRLDRLALVQESRAPFTHVPSISRLVLLEATKRRPNRRQLAASDKEWSTAPPRTSPTAMRLLFMLLIRRIWRYCRVLRSKFRGAITAGRPDLLVEKVYQINDGS